MVDVLLDDGALVDHGALFGCVILQERRLGKATTYARKDVPKYRDTG